MFVTKGRFLGRIPSIYGFLMAIFMSISTTQSRGAAANFSWEQILFKITKPASKNFSPSLYTLELKF